MAAVRGVLTLLGMIKGGATHIAVAPTRPMFKPYGEHVSTFLIDARLRDYRSIKPPAPLR